MSTRRAFLRTVAWALGGPTWLASRAAAGPVTVDEIGDQVQTVPRGQLPDFAGPAPHIRLAYRYE